MARHHLVRRAPILLGLAGALLLSVTALGLQAQDHSYPQLVALFEEWRAFEEPPRVSGGVPDYSPATNAARLAALGQMQARLRAIDTAGWSIPQRVPPQFIQRN